jgi:hypothetical protein
MLSSRRPRAAALGHALARACRSRLSAADSCLGWVISANRKLLRPTSSSPRPWKVSPSPSDAGTTYDRFGRPNSGSPVGSVPSAACRWRWTPLRQPSRRRSCSGGSVGLRSARTAPSSSLSLRGRPRGSLRASAELSGRLACKGWGRGGSDAVEDSVQAPEVLLCGGVAADEGCGGGGAGELLGLGVGQGASR